MEWVFRGVDFYLFSFSFMDGWMDGWMNKLFFYFILIFIFFLPRGGTYII